MGLAVQKMFNDLELTVSKHTKIDEIPYRTIVDPFAVILSIVNNNDPALQLMGRNYDSLFSNDLFFHEESDHWNNVRQHTGDGIDPYFFKMADEVREYYLAKFVTDKLQDSWISVWQQKCGDQLVLTKQNLFKPSLVSTICKLGLQYTYTHTLMDFAKDFNSVVLTDEVEHNVPATIENRELRPVGYTFGVTQVDAGKKIFLLTDKDKHLYMLPIRFNTDGFTFVNTALSNPDTRLTIHGCGKPIHNIKIPEFTYVDIHSSIISDVQFSTSKNRVPEI